ncbi:ankyrin repeat-containing domain protein, partial [Peziza echinospora]
GRDPRFVRAGYSLLQSASVRGLTPFVAALLERGVDPNVPGSYNETALSRACDNAHVETIRTLLEGGASPRSRGWYERTPLMLVARRGDGKGLEALEVLLRGG